MRTESSIDERPQSVVTQTQPSLNKAAKVKEASSLKLQTIGPANLAYLKSDGKGRVFLYFRGLLYGVDNYKLGLLVWEEMPSAYRFSRSAIERTAREWTEAIERDYSHPCVIVWVPFNESWGVPDLPSISAHRHAVEALSDQDSRSDAARDWQ